MSLLTTDIKHLLIALLIGAVIGTEREYRSKSAGFRTMILVCLGSCLFTTMSAHIGLENPDRLAANIITGIGFLGAGVIFKDDNRVAGITTATTIWMVAALGMSVGFGYVEIAVVGTLLVVMVLSVLVYVQNIIESFNQLRNYRILCTYQQETLKRYELMFKEFHLKAIRGKQSKIDNNIVGLWMVQGAVKDHEAFVDCLLKDKDVKEFSF